MMAKDLVCGMDNDENNPPFTTVLWDASRYPSGTYFYRIQTLQFSSIKSMALIK